MCEDYKPHDEFYKDKNRSNLLSSRCKECTKKKAKQDRLNRKLKKMGGQDES